MQAAMRRHSSLSSLASKCTLPRLVTTRFLVPTSAVIQRSSSLQSPGSFRAVSLGVGVVIGSTTQIRCKTTKAKKKREAKAKAKERAREYKMAEKNGYRIAVEGCGHGTLNAIYSEVRTSARKRGWNNVDLVIIGGDFQATRNPADLTVMAVPGKYRQMADFPAYYSGEKKAPYLTIFIGGNHEASAYLSELYYGGWVAPNIYYLGAANVVRFGSLRIAGMSGIWKGHDYRKPHHERLPFNQSDIRSFYHVREFDVRKLLLLREPIDVGLSHDWPRGIERHGNTATLFNWKPHLRAESQAGTLGNPAAAYVMNRLRPAYWFSAHMHCKFPAIKTYGPPLEEGKSSKKKKAKKSKEKTKDSKKKESGAAPAVEAIANPDEIDLDMDDENDLDMDAENDLGVDDNKLGIEEYIEVAGGVVVERYDDFFYQDEGEETESVPEEDVAPADKADIEPVDEAKAEPAGETEIAAPEKETTAGKGVSDALRSQLPASFARPEAPKSAPEPGQPVPPAIKNTTTRFLALDKCLPGRKFLQLCPIVPMSNPTASRKYKSDPVLQYDPEWLAITRVFAQYLTIGDREAEAPPDLGEEVYRPMIERELDWVQKNIVSAKKLAIPHNFVHTAPPYRRGVDPKKTQEQPDEYTNPQTTAFCELLGVPNPWDTTPEERAERKAGGPPPEKPGYEAHLSDRDVDENPKRKGRRGRGEKNKRA